jgi:hypothetical protein
MKLLKTLVNIAIPIIIAGFLILIVIYVVAKTNECSVYRDTLLAEVPAHCILYITGW